MATKVKFTRVNNKELLDIFDAYFKGWEFRNDMTLTSIETTNEGGLYLYWLDDDTASKRKK